MHAKSASGLRRLHRSLPAVRWQRQRAPGQRKFFEPLRPERSRSRRLREGSRRAAYPGRAADEERAGSQQGDAECFLAPPAALRPPPWPPCCPGDPGPNPPPARLASPSSPSALARPEPEQGTPAAHAVPPPPRRRAPRQQPPPPAQQQQQPLAGRLGTRPPSGPPAGMESQCDYFMYFPAVPFPAREVLLGEPGRYRALPRRNHLYLGETVRFLLVLRCRSGAGGAPRPPWGELAGSLSALASVSPAGGGGGGGGAGDEALLGEAAEEGAAGAGEAAANGSVFRECRALLTHGHGARGTTAVTIPPEEPIVSTDEVIFPLTISLDRLPPSTVKAKIVATVWRRDQERGEVRERGYLSILQDRAPSQIFREEQGAFKAQVSTMLTVLPPPELKCQQLNVSGKHLTVLKVLNAASQDELSVWDLRILPNLNASYLPMMPDGSVLLVDDICHQSGEVSMASFCQVPSATSAWPCSVRALEEQNFLFQLQAPEQPPDSTKEGLEVPLIAVLQWSTPKLPFTSSIYTHYRLPSIRLARPRFVMTAECESPVVLHRRFVVTYTLINNLQDFLAVRLVWTPESATAGKKPNVCDECCAIPDPQDSIVCHTPLNNLGFSRKGSARTFCVTFQALRAGLFELSQHMKLKLQFTASVSNPPPEARPVSRKSSPGSPAVRELVGRHQASLGRSQSFSHQQPARGHLLRPRDVT
ncbi:trafficking protein particle complex subunit 14 isoform X2 [Ahaetulla prasina]|uniref:trafficking protein particle complex subunit 14 isoform X2 n=1 Tax=Ahaetulla prasina TaxID=499056 RepID=UPI0026476FBD|nr:trafficking protein particle complex subunit 14 isoform X2 [Ahaetulla prasina]